MSFRPVLRNRAAEHQIVLNFTPGQGIGVSCNCLERVGLGGHSWTYIEIRKVWQPGEVQEAYRGWHEKAPGPSTPRRPDAHSADTVPLDGGARYGGSCNGTVPETSTREGQRHPQRGSKGMPELVMAGGVAVPFSTAERCVQSQNLPRQTASQFTSARNTAVHRDHTNPNATDSQQPPDRT